MNKIMPMVLVLVTVLISLVQIQAQTPIVLLSTNVTTPGKITVLFDPASVVPPEPTNNPPQPTNNPPIPTNGAVIVSTPAQLRTALSGLPPGTTVLIHGGTYPGTYVSTLKGTADQPIVVRNYPGERVIIDGGNSNGNDIFLVRGAYTWFWGLEVMSSSGIRYTTQTGSDPSGSQIPMGEGITTGNEATVVPGIKIINCIIHDVRQGVSMWMNAQNGEVYGCNIYNIGWVAPDRGHGHGVYTQNQNGIRSVVRNTAFGVMSHGLQSYGSENAPLQNIQFIQNYAADDFDRPFVLGGGQVATAPVILGNLWYTTGGASQVGYGKPVSGGNISSNWFIVPNSNGGTSGNALRFVGSSTLNSYSGNNFYGQIINNPSGGSGNINLTSLPSQVIAYPNKYEQRRGTIGVINGALNTSISFNLAQFGFVTGDHYYIHDNEDYYGDAVLEGLYAGGFLTIPLKPRPAVLPIGNIPAEFIPKTTEPSLYLLTATSTKY